jgi:hypothetical protein
MKNRYQIKLCIARCLIALVVIDNLQAAVLFLVKPADFAPSFELGGTAGNASIQGIGLLFAMWTVPYIFAMIHPVKYRISLIEALIMQTIGLVGEMVLLNLLPVGMHVLEGSVERFIYFDAAGLILLLGAFLLTRSLQYKKG